MELNNTSNREHFFEIRLSSVATGIPLPYDLYLVVNEKAVLFRKRQDVLTRERLKMLVFHGGEKFLIPTDQRDLYLKSLKDLVHDPGSTTELKSKYIKESAFLHVHDLFTKQDIRPVITEAKTLVEEMVNFLSTDVNAVASLMRLSIHDYYTYNHCVDVSVYSIVLAKRIFGENHELLISAGLGGFLHDIGKRRVDSRIINKSTPLTPDEWNEIRKHPDYGKEFLDDIATIPDQTKLVVYEHHENFDGTGYPLGLNGENISDLAKVVTIADVFDALTTDRSYHKAVAPNEAMDIMFGMQPGKFDPNIFLSFNKKFTHKSHLSLDRNFDPCQPTPVFKR